MLEIDAGLEAEYLFGAGNVGQGVFDVSGSGFGVVGGDVDGGAGTSKFPVNGGTLNLTGQINGVGSVSILGGGSFDFDGPGSTTAGAVTVGAGGTATLSTGSVTTSCLPRNITFS